MKRSALIILVSTAAIVLATSPSHGQRGGRGGGGRGGFGGGGGGRSSVSRPSVNRSPSMSRPSASRSATSRPSPSPSQRPPVNRPPVNRPSTQPGSGAGQRPSSNQIQQFLKTPQNKGPRPGAGSLPAVGGATRPGVDRSKIGQSIGATPGQRPAMPDWFQDPCDSRQGDPALVPAPGGLPTAGQLPALPGAGNSPGQRPPGQGRPPGGLPTAGQLPALPGVGNPPGQRHQDRAGHPAGHQQPASCQHYPESVTHPGSAHQDRAGHPAGHQQPASASVTRCR